MKHHAHLKSAIKHLRRTVKRLVLMYKRIDRYVDNQPG